MDRSLNALIVVGTFHVEICRHLVDGAVSSLKKYSANALYQIIEVPGALEIPAAISFAIMSDRETYDGYIALGCVLKGQTDHNRYVSSAVFSALNDIAVHHAVPLGVGIITADTPELAMERADMNGLNVGGGAASAMVRMVEHYRRYLG
ncbi:MAG: 6,7-dimethyl-8-ribityllumazine synthase [Aaplasma endosymbiont of Hyalomma asiaticum]